MPSLLFNDGTVKNTSRSSPEMKLPPSAEILSATVAKSAPTPRYSNYSPEARRYLWIGVTLLSGIIFLLWGWSLKLQFTAINWNALPEKKLLDVKPTDWNTIFAEREANRSAAAAKAKIRLLITELSAVASSTTSTPSITSTSPDSDLSWPKTPPTLPSSKKLH